MSDQWFVGVSRDEQIQLCQDAMQAAREEHDVPDAPESAVVAQICAAYVGFEGPLGEEGDELTTRVDDGETTFAYRNKIVSYLDGETLDIPDNARALSIDKFGTEAIVRYLVPVQTEDGDDQEREETEEIARVVA